MNKPYYKSKTVIACVILAVAVIYKIISSHQISAQDIVYLATALGLFGIRDAIE